jgi:hypothetical protein
MRQHVASFANFVCRFGEKKVLLDYAKEFLISAFTDDTLIREYGHTQFFFYETKLVRLRDDPKNPILGIAGRFIKNTVLTREQLFDPKRGLIQDEASLSTAPSAHFVLVLNNHRLIYFPETAHAPDFNAFRSTALHFIQRKRKAFIDALYQEARDADEKVTKKSLNEIHPSPTLEIVPISGDDEIADFLERYEILKKIEFRLVKPNDEIDGEELFQDIREYLNPLQPENTKIEIRNSEGLEIEHALPRIQAATATDNQIVKLAGKDHDGNDLRGDNHKFQISAPVDPIPATRTDLTNKLFNIFSDLGNSGAIKIPQQSQAVAEKIRSLLGLL